MEQYSPSQIDVKEMSGEMEERRRKVEERCREVLTMEERQKEINSNEFLISDKYKLIWCNIFKSASSTWMYNFLLMGGKQAEDPERNCAIPRVQGQDRDYSALLQTTSLPDHQEIPIEGGEGRKQFDFVSYLLDEESEGKPPNEHWAPYYTFCSPCAASFDLVLRFETLHKDEMFLLEKVPGLSQVVSPKVMHNSHFNYTALTASYFTQLSSQQLLGLTDLRNARTPYTPVKCALKAYVQVFTYTPAASPHQPISARVPALHL
ncbi:hypothetical protein O3P69_019635 [Scylla paramamosain]|uniref:Carbohydrate sulfotransferase n=1 Tax=Scylla paramamosain TaxID=85552 RepID=A0AAW0SXM1_SCYPA